jgi:hypothetical protein
VDYEYQDISNARRAEIVMKEQGAIEVLDKEFESVKA